MIDNVLLRNINLKEFQRAMTVLVKNAALFSGSVRKNLKVREQFQDAELWLALEQEQEKRGSVGLRVVGEWCKFKYRRTETNLLGSRVAATKQNRHLG